MKKLYFLLLICFATVSVFGQVGINTTDPKAQLDIKASSETAPSNTDGILIPRVNAFPSTSPTAAQQAMMIYLTTAVGANLPQFYFWDNTGVPAWKPITGASGGTLDQAYDFGGAGNGKTITADAGAVLIDGTDGLVSTGIFNTGAIAPSGAGTRMVWNPRKGAFRAGRVIGTQWDDANVGIYSIAFGIGTTASGEYSAAFGYNNTASGEYSAVFGAVNTVSGEGSTAFGNNNTVSGNFSTAFGQSHTASGVYSTAFGQNNTAIAFASTSFGYKNNAKSLGETVFGIGATDYTSSTNGNTQFRTANATDRLFVIGNAIDANNNAAVDLAERRDALIILKNGLTRLPSTTNAMITAADGKAVVTKEYLQNNGGGTLDQAYDFGGAGLGKTITADAGAVLIDGTDGFISTGTIGSGATTPSGAGTRMVWNPRKAAFRAGNVNGTQWDDINVGFYSFAAGFRSIASGITSTAFGYINTANGSYASVFGSFNTANGDDSIVFGVNNTSRSVGETVLGIGATEYTPSSNGDTQFRIANATDRLLVVGNAIDVDNDGTVDTSERSDALIILKNGLTRLPSTTNAMITAADGKAIVTKEYLQSNTSAWDLTGNAGTNATTNFIGTTDNVDVIFKRNNFRAGLLGLSNTSFGIAALISNTTGTNNTANGRTALQSNTTGTDNTANGAEALRVNTTGTKNTAIGWTALASNTIGTDNTANGFFALGGNTTGSENSSLGYFTNVSTGNLTNATAIGSRAMVGSSNSLVLGSVSGVNGATSSVNVGIGTITPDRKLEVSGPAGLVATRITNTSTTGATSNVALEFFRATNANTDWQIYNIGPFLTIGNSLDDLATVNELYQFQGVRFMPMTDATINLGQSANRWNTLFASNGTINTSDEREKKNIQNINYGLEDLLKLRPVSFEWKKEDGSGKKLGLIAQELQKVIPEVVRDWDWQEDEKGNPSKIPASTLGVYYSDLIPVLIKSIQEQQSIIDTQKIQLEAQAKTITTILNRLSTLENN